MENLNTIPVLEKAIQVLEYIGAHPGRVSQSEIKNALKIPQATCYRIISTMVEYNWLVKVNGNHYDISTGILPITRKVSFQLERYKVLQPILEHLAKKVGYSVKLSVRDGDEQVNVLCAKAPWDIALTTSIGSRDHLMTGGSVGVILAAEMTESELSKLSKSLKGKTDTDARLQKLKDNIKDFKETGYVFNPASPDPKYKWHVDALSIPVYNDQNQIAGAITLLSTPGGLAEADWAALTKEMTKTAEFCSDTMS